MSAMAAATVTDVEYGTRDSIQTRNGVTASDFLGAVAFANRNAPSFDRGAWQEARRRHFRAMQFGQSCGLCDRDLTQDEPVWRARAFNAGRPFDPRWLVTILCQACRPTSREWHSPHACDTCGRMVVLEVGGPRLRMHVFCCDRCASRWHNHQRNQRARKTRERICPICAQPFVGTRRDATTCSPACRQKAYRLRKGRKLTCPP